MITCTKRYSEFPFAHRQHRHDGHCRLIHGHNFDFEFTFGADRLDSNGFVIDFGKLKPLKDWLTKRFDHTLVLNQDDPHLPFLKTYLEGQDEGFADIVVVPNCGAEGLARFLLEEVNKMFSDATHLLAAGLVGEVRVVSVTVYEDSKNSATYSLPC